MSLPSHSRDEEVQLALGEREQVVHHERANDACRV